MLFRKLIVVGFALLFIGCGKDLTVNVMPGSEEKESEVPELIRKLELRYFNASGRQEGLATKKVQGMKAGTSLDSESLENVEWSEDGHWEARAYSSTDDLLMYGSASARPNREDNVNVMLSLAGAQASMIQAGLIQSIQILGVDYLKSYRADLKELSSGIAVKKCLSLPTIGVDPRLKIAPRISFLSNSSEFYVEPGAFVRGSFQSFVKSPVKIYPVSNTHRGFSLDQSFELKELQSKPMNWVVKVYSGSYRKYEGCLRIHTAPIALPLELSTHVHPAIHDRLYFGGIVRPFLELRVKNPNLFGMQYQVRGRLGEGSLNHPLRVAYNVGSNDGKYGYEICTSGDVNAKVTIGAGATASIWILAGFNTTEKCLQTHPSVFDYGLRRKGTVIGWTVEPLGRLPSVNTLKKSKATYRVK